MSISILKTYNDGVSLEEALSLSKQKPFLTNLEHDALLSGEGYKQYKSAYWAWSGTHIQYESGSTTALVWNEGEKKKTKIFLPLNDGWYLVNNKYGIPNGEPSSESNPNARKLWRWQDRDYSGLVSRIDDYLFYDGRRVVVCYVSGFRHGVLVKSRQQAGKRSDKKESVKFLEWLSEEKKNHVINGKYVLLPVVDVLERVEEHYKKFVE